MYTFISNIYTPIFSVKMNMKNVIIAAFFLSAATATQAQVVGNDADAHGCRASAGYTYSSVLKECIQVFNRDIKLDGLIGDTKGYVGTVIFSKDKKKAELFIKETTPSIVLNRKGKEGSYVWQKGDYSLTESNGYTVKKGNTEIYKGK
jgi:hypothetical protein